MTWHVYLLRCADGTLYAGITTDLARRLADHNSGRAGARYTRARRPVTLAWSEPAGGRGDALRREHQLRRLSRVEKEALISAAPRPSAYRPARHPATPAPRRHRRAP